jgi:hypothetical protein
MAGRVLIGVLNRTKELAMSARRALVALIGLIVVPLSASAAPPTTQPSRAELEQKFERTMNHATLVGSFTLDGSDRSPRTDRYAIGAVTKKEGDHWIFTASLNYAGHDLPIPIELPVKWAGDTPVITVDHVGIPGMSTYDARVMIVGNEYVGTWSHSDGSHAGKMWGHIERGATTQPSK